MQSGVGALIILNVDGDLRSGAKPLSMRKFVTPCISRDYVIVLARWHTLLKFSTAVGVELPACFLVFGATDFDFHTRHRPIIRSPDCAEKERIVRRLRSAAVLR